MKRILTAAGVVFLGIPAAFVFATHFWIPVLEGVGMPRDLASFGGYWVMGCCWIIAMVYTGGKAWEQFEK